MLREMIGILHQPRTSKTLSAIVFFLIEIVMPSAIHVLCSIIKIFM